MEYVPGGDCAALLSALAGPLPLDLTTYAFCDQTFQTRLTVIRSEFSLINYGYMEDYEYIEEHIYTIWVH